MDKGTERSLREGDARDRAVNKPNWWQEGYTNHANYAARKGQKKRLGALR